MSILFYFVLAQCFAFLVNTNISDNCDRDAYEANADKHQLEAICEACSANVIIGTADVSLTSKCKSRRVTGSVYI